MPINRECLKKCLKAKLPWFIGDGTISVLASILIGLGVMFPGVGTVAAILIGLGLLIFVSATAILTCMANCRQ